MYEGHRDTFVFSKGTDASRWEFSVDDGEPMVCGSILDHATFTPLSGALLQDPAESNYGVPLKPGDYVQISSYTARETCVYPVQGGLDAVGDLVYQQDVTGVVATPSRKFFRV